MSISVSQNVDGTNSKSVKDMLRAGTSPEELLSELQKEIDGAQEELEAEAASKHSYTEERIEAYREILVEDAIDYLNALGILQEIPDFDIDSEEDYDTLYEVMLETLEKTESQLKVAMALVSPWLKVAVATDHTNCECDNDTCKCEHKDTFTGSVAPDAVTRLKAILSQYDL